MGVGEIQVVIGSDSRNRRIMLKQEARRENSAKRMRRVYRRRRGNIPNKVLSAKRFSGTSELYRRKISEWGFEMVNILVKWAKTEI